jgi:hypothetical protein
MKKIISLFKRDYEGNRQIIDETVPGAEWVTAGEGIATIKIDGTCCMVRGGKLYKRYDHKPDNWKAIQRVLKYGGTVPIPIISPAPDGFESAQDPDPVTLHWPGWLLVGDGPEDKWHREAFETGNYEDGTYELIGPKIQGNPYKYDSHTLIKHGFKLFATEPPRDFEGLKSFFESHKIEGIVWHHPDGRMVKIKRRDFGYRWPES